MVKTQAFSMDLRITISREISLAIWANTAILVMEVFLFEAPPVWVYWGNKSTSNFFALIFLLSTPLPNFLGTGDSPCLTNGGCVVEWVGRKTEL